MARSAAAATHSVATGALGADIRIRGAVETELVSANHTRPALQAVPVPAPRADAAVEGAFRTPRVRALHAILRRHVDSEPRRAGRANTAVLRAVGAVGVLAEAAAGVEDPVVGRALRADGVVGLAADALAVGAGHAQPVPGRVAAHAPGAHVGIRGALDAVRFQARDASAVRGSEVVGTGSAVLAVLVAGEALALVAEGAGALVRAVHCLAFRAHGGVRGALQAAGIVAPVAVARQHSEAVFADLAGVEVVAALNAIFFSS